VLDIYEYGWIEGWERKVSDDESVSRAYTVSQPRVFARAYIEVEAVPVKVKWPDKSTCILSTSTYTSTHCSAFTTMSAQASSSTQDDVLQTQYSTEEIATFNKELDGKTPQEILVWAIDHLDGLFQTTAFGLYVFPD